jgi:FAD:protein FMN transferase
VAEKAGDPILPSRQPVLVARHAMATRFEIVLHGPNLHALRAAGEEALDEIDRVEAQLSLYRPSSEVARLNREAHERPVRITPTLFKLLERARDLSRETNGAFDITIAPLVRCWGFMNGTGSMPDPDAVRAARETVGMHLVELDSEHVTARFTRPGVMLDFGAMGKGYAIERAAEILRDTGVTSALIHGGTSTVYALGRQPDEASWKIAITPPDNSPDTEPLAVVELENESLSVSAVWGRSFQIGGETYGHIIDPRTGAPAMSARLSAVVLPSATDSDALSTALLTAPELIEKLAEQRPALRCLVVAGANETIRVSTHRINSRESF